MDRSAGFDLAPLTTFVTPGPTRGSRFSPMFAGRASWTPDQVRSDEMFRVGKRPLAAIAGLPQHECMTLFITIALAALSAPSLPLRASDLLREGFGIPRDLFYLAQQPSGTVFCDKTLRRRQNREFDKRYGDRFSRLVKVVREREGLGWKPDEIITTPCLRLPRKLARSLLDQFEHDLRAYEARYGLENGVHQPPITVVIAQPPPAYQASRSNMSRHSGFSAFE